jgi:8-oxo-dGTP diphosphatase
MTKGPLWVVAGALEGPGDTWLMHRRPLEKHHGGLWEFPGGKVEETEIPVKALIRELREELGVAIDEADCMPAGFAEDRGGDGGFPIVILLYKVGRWQGSPTALEGGQVDWFSPTEIPRLPKPPLDHHLAEGIFGKAPRM